MRCAC